MAEIIGRDCDYQDIIPIPGRKLVMHTNRHPNCDGSLWGWVEGCTSNICWSDNRPFNRAACSKVISEYNERQEAKK